MKPLSATFAFWLSQTILVPFIIGLVRYRRIGKMYRPFFYLLVIGVLAEFLSRYLIHVAHVPNAIPSNCFVLLEWILVCWQFHVWGLHARKEVFMAILLLPVAIWITENLVFGNIVRFSPYFRVFDGFLIVMLSVNKINFMITHDDRRLYGNAIFLICIGLIIFFIYRIILEWAYQTSLNGATGTTNTIIMLDAWVNALTNIIFALALLRLPRPRKFTLR
ncbi:MAG TPA: hypothetical protein VHE54_16445 [Puia sp.]|nr:hypothetical protein [Puia sp.]